MRPLILRRRLRHAGDTLGEATLEMIAIARRTARWIFHPPYTLEDEGWVPIQPVRCCDPFTRVEFTMTHARGDQVRIEHWTGAFLHCSRAELERMTRLPNKPSEECVP